MGVQSDVSAAFLHPGHCLHVSLNVDLHPKSQAHFSACQNHADETSVQHTHDKMWRNTMLSSVTLCRIPSPFFLGRNKSCLSLSHAIVYPAFLPASLPPFSFSSAPISISPSISTIIHSSPSHRNFQLPCFSLPYLSLRSRYRIFFLSAVLSRAMLQNSIVPSPSRSVLPDLLHLPDQIFQIWHPLSPHSSMPCRVALVLFLSSIYTAFFLSRHPRTLVNRGTENRCSLAAKSLLPRYTQILQQSARCSICTFCYPEVIQDSSWHMGSKRIAFVRLSIGILQIKLIRTVNFAPAKLMLTPIFATSSGFLREGTQE